MNRKGRPWRPTCHRPRDAKRYRFLLEPEGRIRSEIPTLHDVVHGRVVGQPMSIRHLKPPDLVGHRGGSPRSYLPCRQSGVTRGRRAYDIGRPGQSLGGYVPVDGRPDLAGESFLYDPTRHTAKRRFAS